ncbi:hypothetical protein SRHO_G00251620 [Serrasalmus rhombeus]
MGGDVHLSHTAEGACAERAACSHRATSTKTRSRTHTPPGGRAPYGAPSPCEEKGLCRNPHLPPFRLTPEHWPFTSLWLAEAGKKQRSIVGRASRSGGRWAEV